MTEPITWFAASILANREVADGVRELCIAPEDALPAGTPGCHIAVRLDTQRGDIVRTYSLLDGGDGAPYRIAVKLVADSRGGSVALSQSVPGQRLHVSVPRNNFPLVPGAGLTLLIAGGIGVTPIVSMARALAQAGRPFQVLYGVRSRQDLAFAGELRAVAGSRLSVLVSDEGRRLDFASIFAALQPDDEAYVCGPPRMMDAARSAWAAHGRAPAGLRLETFGVGGYAPNQDFTVTIPRLGRHIDVSARESLLDALERSGIQMISFCRKGECGLCALSVLATDRPIDHRDVFFSAEERQAGTKLCTCVSRVAGGTLVLDTADRSPLPSGV